MADAGVQAFVEEFALGADLVGQPFFRRQGAFGSVLGALGVVDAGVAGIDRDLAGDVDDQAGVGGDHALFLHPVVVPADVGDVLLFVV